MKKNNKIILKFWAPVVLWMAVISVFSSIPRLEIPPLIPYFDKVGHSLEFLILGILLTRAFLNSDFSVKFSYAAILTISIIALYAMVDEWHQKFIPGRSCEIADFLSDCIGAAIGIFIYTRTYRASNKTV